VTAEGTADGSFGVDGVAIAGFPDNSAETTDLALQPDGKIVLVGTIHTPNRHDFGAVITDTNTIVGIRTSASCCSLWNSVGEPGLTVLRSVPHWTTFRTKGGRTERSRSGSRGIAESRLR